MADDIPQYEFTAAQEMRMRKPAIERRADPAQLAQVASEFAPAAAQDAREAAARRLARRGKE